MSKQSDIRGGRWQILRKNGLHVLEADTALNELEEFDHSQGVVIRVDREFPTCGISEVLTGNAQAAGCPFIKANYQATEPLIDRGER